MKFYMDEALGPRFVVFHYLIKWYIDNFGLLSYMCAVVGSITALFAYAVYINVQKGEKDRAMLILMLAVIVSGGLVGLGIDMSNGYMPIR